MTNTFTFDHAKFDLERYSDFERRTIDAYFATIALTRKTKKLADGVIATELSYWAKYPIEAVMYALREHIRKYAGKREHYTRGILRNHVSAGRAKEGIHAFIGKNAAALVGTSSGRGKYGQGEDRSRYVSADDELPI